MRWGNKNAIMRFVVLILVIPNGDLENEEGLRGARDDAPPTGQQQMIVRTALTSGSELFRYRGSRSYFKIL